MTWRMFKNTHMGGSEKEMQEALADNEIKVVMQHGQKMVCWHRGKKVACACACVNTHKVVIDYAFVAQKFPQSLCTCALYKFTLH